MKKIIVFAILTILLLLNSCKKEKNEITVYMPGNYSWLIKNGNIPDFEKENNVKIKAVFFDGASKIITRLMLEKSNPKADIVMGLNQVSYTIAKKNNLLEKYRPKNYYKIKNDINIISKEYYATIFDYGALAFIYNPSKIKTLLKSFSDIAKLKNKLIMSDPRTSTTGQDFLLWTIAVYGNDWQNYWKSIKNSFVTITPDWDSAFAKFETGEADIMVSYASDEAYSMYTYNTDKYKVFIPEEGGFLEIEANALVKKTKINPKAEKFIDFCLSDKVQGSIALNNWMIPVTDVKLPEVFTKYYKIPKKYKTLNEDEIANKLQEWLASWSKIMTY